MKTVLLTGFEPFAGQALNPSALAVRQLDGHTIAGRRIATAILPVAFGDAEQSLLKAIRTFHPELVICVGEAGGRSGLSIERVAINLDDARIPDNCGAQPIEQPIAAHGPAAYWSTLPVQAIVSAIREKGIPVNASETAGTFVCNHVFYCLMRTLGRRRGIFGGFIHVPFVPEQAKKAKGKPPSLPLAQIVAGLSIAVETALRARKSRR